MEYESNGDTVNLLDQRQRGRLPLGQGHTLAKWHTL